MSIKTVMGPAGAPMRPPYGSFSGKPAAMVKSGRFTVMGPGGAPMRPLYGSFSGKGPLSTGVVDWIVRARRRNRR